MTAQHQLVTAEQYDSWTEEQCAGIEIVNGLIVVTPSASLRHNRLARFLANALDRADPAWLADCDFDVRLQDVPLINRRPDVIVYRAEAIDTMPARPEHILMLVEIVSPGSESVDRTLKAVEYARAGIRYYWRVEDATTKSPVVHTYRLAQATQTYQATEVFVGVVSAKAPFPVEIDLRTI